MASVNFADARIFASEDVSGSGEDFSVAVLQPVSQYQPLHGSAVTSQPRSSHRLSSGSLAGMSSVVSLEQELGVDEPLQQRHLDDFLLAVALVKYLSDKGNKTLGLGENGDSIINIMSGNGDDVNLSSRSSLDIASMVVDPVFASVIEDERFTILESELKEFYPSSDNDQSGNLCLSRLRSLYKDVKYRRTFCGAATRFSCTILLHNFLQDWICMGLCRWLSMYNLDSESVGKMIWGLFKRCLGNA